MAAIRSSVGLSGWGSRAATRSRDRNDRTHRLQLDPPKFTATAGTRVQVIAEDLPQPIPQRFLGRWFWRTNTQELPDHRQFDAAMTVGQASVVTDPHETVGQHVAQEPSADPVRPHRTVARVR